jgi:hypothetical protein
VEVKLCQLHNGIEMRLTTKNPNKIVKERGGEEGEEAGYVRALGLAGLLLVRGGSASGLI